GLGGRAAAPGGRRVRGASAASARGVLASARRRPAARGDRAGDRSEHRDRQVAPLLRAAPAARSPRRRRGRAMKGCLELAPELADPARTAVASHLATCPSCRATAATVAIVRGGVVAETPDLWERVRARVHQREEVVVRLPRLGWEAAAAVAAVAVTVALAPEPGRLLAVLLGMV